MRTIILALAASCILAAQTKIIGGGGGGTGGPGGAVSSVAGKTGAVTLAAADLTDLHLTKTAASVLTISGSWIFDGGSLCTITNATITADAGTSGVAYIGVEANCNLAVVMTGGLNVTGSGVTLDESAGTGYLADSAPIYAWAATSAVWDAAATEEARTIVRGPRKLSEDTAGGVNIDCTSGTECKFSADYNDVLSPATAQAGTPWLCSGSASATAQTCTLTPGLTALTTGMRVRWKSGATNTSGAITLDLDAGGALAAKSIKKSDGTTDPSASEIATGEYRDLTYDGTVFRLPPAGGAASHVKKCYVPGLTNGTATATVLGSATLDVTAPTIIRVSAIVAATVDVPRWDVQYAGSTIVGTYTAGAAGEAASSVITLYIPSATDYYAYVVNTRTNGLGAQATGSSASAGTWTGSQTLSIRGSIAAPTTGLASIRLFCVEQLPATP